MMEKSIMKTFVLWIVFSIWFFLTAFLFIRAANFTAVSWTPLTATNWNEMISNFFWWSWSGGIYYNGKVWIWTNSPNRKLHIYDTSENAEIDLQSVSWAWKHWWIYQDAITENLHIRNGSDRVIITTWWNLNLWWTINAWGTLNAAGWLCINWDCKTSWSQVLWSNTWVYQFTWTSISCDLSNAWKLKYSDWYFYWCDGSSWSKLSWNSWWATWITDATKLIGNIHTVWDCKWVSWVAFNVWDWTYICKLSWTVCPSWWSQHNSWTTTTSASCTWGSPIYWGSSCGTAYHGFADLSRETCSYSPCSIGKNTSCRAATCSANISEVWCK